MPLESFLALVHKLRERIDAHGDKLRQSEALTRYALIDPLLRELGWDTSDPALLIPEYRSGGVSADYALLDNGSPAMMVEAKKLGTPLRDAVLAQGINYCLMEGTKHFSVTDGQLWEVYETHKPVPIDEKRIVSFDLKGQPPAEACLQALALWRPAVEAGTVAAGEEPVVKSGEEPYSGHRAPRGPRPDEHEWHSLAEVTADTGQRPIEMSFPDGGPIAVKNWRVALEELVRWLTDRRILQASHCPIVGSSPKASRYMVHTQPIHSNGNPFRSPMEVNGLWVDKDGDRRALINKTKTIIEHVGQDPAQFKVRFP